MGRDNIAITNAAISLAGGSGSAGVLATLAAPSAANDAMFDNQFGRTLLLFVNGFGGVSATTTVITVVSVADPYSRSGDLTLSVAPGNLAVCGPFPPLLFNQTSGADINKVYINYDTTGASQQHAALRVPVS